LRKGRRLLAGIRRIVRIAIDAMGGDYAPQEIVQGAVEAAEKDKGVEPILVGPLDILEKELAKYDTSGLKIRCVHADDFIERGENPALAVRHKPNSSIAVAARMVKAGEADGLLGATDTGALIASIMQYLGMIAGIDRPVFGGALPGFAPKTAIFDLGANMDCKPQHLLNFGIIGTVYARIFMNIPHPTVALLNVGVEEGKGNQLAREAYSLFRRSSLNFIGNMEGGQLRSGLADVAICDAFVGNIVLKLIESLGLFADSDVPGAYRDLGGGIIWGANGIVRKLHGNSRARHVAVKINDVKQVVEVDLIGALKSEFARVMKELK
jgi:glycerol-3-phosphate acyltransferase PlsX